MTAERGDSRGGGTVVAIHISPGHGRPKYRVPSAEAIANAGLRDDAHGRPGGKRQVLLMPVEVLEQLDLPPGSVKETFTTRGCDVMGLRPGDRVRVGQTLLEITGECEPCGHMDEIRSGLQEELRGRRGMLARVLEGGPVQEGDPIVLESTTAAPQARP
ncbi:MAG: MOSC domain-containing protein [Armatimonadetes bacterium]|nr:MOSC domain-containing protein [Armatimonadota bacterium]